MSNLLDVLAQLDHANDAHWTAQGLPSLSALKELVGDSVSVTRQDVTDAAPDFKRVVPENISIDSDGLGAELGEAKGKVDINADTAMESADVQPTLDEVLSWGGEHLLEDEGRFDVAAAVLQENYATLLKEIEYKKRLVAVIQKRHSDLKDFKNALNPEGRNLLNKQLAQLQHNRRMQEEQARQDRLNSLNLGAADLDALMRGKPAAIDAAMRARKPSREGGRPSWPLKTAQPQE